MIHPASSIVVLISVGCNWSSALPVETKHNEPENGQKSHGESLQKTLSKAESGSFFPVDEKWLELDGQRWSHLRKRDVINQPEREARKRPYIPLNSLTFMTADNEVAPFNWHSSNGSDIQDRIAVSKLAGYKRPSDPNIDSSSKGPTTLHSDVTKEPNKFLLFYTTTKRPIPSNEFHHTQRSRAPTIFTSVTLPPRASTLAHTTGKQNFIDTTVLPARQNSFLSNPSKLITFVPVLENTTPPPYRPISLVTLRPKTESPTSIPTRKPTQNQQLTASRPSSAKKPGLRPFTDRPATYLSDPEENTVTENVTEADTTNNIPTYSPPEDIITWFDNNGPTTSSYVTAQYFLQRNPTNNSANEKDNSTQKLTNLQSSPSSNSTVQQPERTSFIQLQNTELTSMNPPVNHTSAPLTITDKLVLEEAFSRMKDQNTLFTASHDINRDKIPVLDTNPVSLGQGTAGFSSQDSAQFYSGKPDESPSGHINIRKPDPAAESFTILSTSLSLDSLDSSSLHNVKPTSSELSTTATSSSGTQDTAGFNKVKSNENEQSLAQPSLLYVSGDDHNYSGSLITPNSLTKENNLTTDYEYDFYEDDLNSVESLHHLKRDSYLNTQSYGSSNSEHHAVVVKLWEMINGQLNLVREEPVPMELFHNTSLRNGAVVNPQDVPSKVMAMVSSKMQAQHPLLNPEIYHQSRVRRSSEKTDLISSPSHKPMQQPLKELLAELSQSRFHQLSTQVSLSKNQRENLQETRHSPEVDPTNESVTKSSSDTIHQPSIEADSPKSEALKQSRSSSTIQDTFGGIGNPNHANLPLSIGTALEETNINYLQTLNRFADQIATTARVDPTLISNLRQFLHAPQVNSATDFSPTNNGIHNIRIGSQQASILQENSVPLSNQNIRQQGSVLEYLPHDLPHVNPLVASSGTPVQNPVDLGKVLTSLPSSSTLTREQLKDKLTHLTGTNTFSGHLGNQGFISHNAHAAQNSVSGNYMDHTQVFQSSNQKHLGNVNRSFMTQRKFQQQVPTKEDEAYYPFAHQTESSRLPDQILSFNSPSEQLRPQNQHFQNIQPATFSNIHNVLPEILSQNVVQQQNPLDTINGNPFFQHQLTGLPHQRIPEQFGSETFNIPNIPSDDSHSGNLPPISTQQLLGISNYPTPLLDFLFRNASVPSFEPQQDQISPLQDPQPTSVQSVFDPFNPYIPAASDYSILGGVANTDTANVQSVSLTPIKPVAATFSGGTGTSPAKCQANTACLLGLAGLASAAMAKALLIPFLAGRRRRSLSNNFLNEKLVSQMNVHHFLSNSPGFDLYDSEDVLTNTKKKHISQFSASVKESNLRNDKNIKRVEPLEVLFYSLPKEQQLYLMKYALDVLIHGQVNDGASGKGMSS